MGTSDNSAKVRRVAELARECRRQLEMAQVHAIRRVSDVGRATLGERTYPLIREVEEQLRAHDASGVPPPLLRLAKRSDDEKPYNRYLGWLFDPRRNHAVALPALLALAGALRFESLRADLACGTGIHVQCEDPWPAWPNGGSSGQPDLLVITPTAILLVENKVRSGESGDQYPQYRAALTAFAAHKGIAAENARAHLLAPERSAQSNPRLEGWGQTLTHAELVELLVAVSEKPELPHWDRALCFLVADAFCGDRGVAERLAQAREVLGEITTRGVRPRDAGRLSQLLPLPQPFRWKGKQ